MPPAMRVRPPEYQPRHPAAVFAPQEFCGLAVKSRAMTESRVVLTRRDLFGKFSNRARTWERSYLHPGSEASGGAYQVFFNPRLLSDSRFWQILNMEDSVWKQILDKAFGLSTALCCWESGWKSVNLSNVKEIVSGSQYMMARLESGELLPIGSRNEFDHV